MRIICVGGGPAGLFFAILAKRLHEGNSVRVIDRFPEGVTYGWGVVFWDGLLEDLERTDRETARKVRDNAFRWADQVVHVEGREPARIPGHGFGMGRHTLLAILSERARALGVKLEFGREIDDISELAGSDLIVASDGVNSGLRQRYGEGLGTTVLRGRNKYIWLGTSKVFESFTFPFVHTPAGWIWGHAYAFDRQSSTFIVETSPETWEGLGFDGLPPDESMRLLESIFEAYLDGHQLRPQVGTRESTPWLEFLTVTNRRWHHRNVVLMGDAAHTTHFTIGSGTRLALEDAIELATQLRRREELDRALAAYGDQRAADLVAAQREARNSASWFENLSRYIGHDSPDFARLLVGRRSSFLPRMPPRSYLRLTHAASRAPVLARPARRVVSGWRELSLRGRRSP
jgi:anthraniloyl-CoA monooxygenase